MFKANRFVLENLCERWAWLENQTLENKVLWKNKMERQNSNYFWLRRDYPHRSCLSWWNKIFDETKIDFKLQKYWHLIIKERQDWQDCLSVLLLYRRGFNPDNFTAPLPAARGGFLCAGVQERESSREQMAGERWSFAWQAGTGWLLYYIITTRLGHHL